MVISVVVIIQFRHSTSVNVRLSYLFRALLLWMLSSLFFFQEHEGKNISVYLVDNAGHHVYADQAKQFNRKIFIYIEFN